MRNISHFSNLRRMRNHYFIGDVTFPHDSNCCFFACSLIINWLFAFSTVEILLTAHAAEISCSTNFFSNLLRFARSNQMLCGITFNWTFWTVISIHSCRYNHFLIHAFLLNEQRYTHPELCLAS